MSLLNLFVAVFLSHFFSLYSFERIRQEVPGWGRYVAKEECANHICKFYRTNLEKLVSDNQLCKGRHHLSKTTRVRLVSAMVNRLSNVIAQSFCCSIFITLFFIVFF
jgi:hypothetical protein